MTDHSFVLKMALRKALVLVKGPCREISSAEEDIIVLNLMRELHLAGYEIVKRPSHSAPQGGRPRRLVRATARRWRKTERRTDGAGDFFGIRRTNVI